MRARRLWALLACAAACSSERVGPPPPAPVNWQSLARLPEPDAGDERLTAKERALPDVYAAALGSPRFAQLAPLLDEEAHLMSPGLGDAHGRARVVAAYDALFGAFDDRKAVVGRVWRTASEQTIEWTMTALQNRDWMDIPATHRSVAFRALTLIWTKDDGSITDVHVYLDTAIVKA
ncbi:MAG: nuclear transport factor 2 family protein, partial [Myxococcales bacterium]|nr:nuclear transport factor 2 family protein [Myxococcales bacterium]